MNFSRNIAILAALVVGASMASPGIAVAQEPPRPWESLVPAGTLVFNLSTGRINVRSGPGRDQRVLDTLAVGGVATVQVCLDGAEWCVVQYDAGWRVGWVLTETLTRIDDDTPEPTISELRNTAVRKFRELQRPVPRPATDEDTDDGDADDG